MKVRTRFAPSPTGFLHIGGARTALFSWLFARKHGGDFVLRIEDTDIQRSTIESVNAILEGMNWLGLDYDEGPIHQTERMGRYKEVIERLLDEGKAYYCYCSKERLDAMREEQRARGEKPRYDGRCRHRKGPPPAGVDPVVRFKNPQEGEVVVEDAVRGTVTFANQELDDLIIARSDGTPTYNLTVVVDDLDMGMTHVIRGDDHLNNTPRQINILRALGEQPPIYGHVPMILGPDGKRLSKRHGAMSVMEYHNEGFLPEAVLNYLVRLGWSHGDQEVFDLDEMVEHFELEAVNRAASTFNTEKLLWLNQQHMMRSRPEHLARHLSWHLGNLGIDPEREGPSAARVAETLRERSKTLKELAESGAYFFRDFEAYDEKAAKKHFRGPALNALEHLYERLAAVEDWQAGILGDVVKAVCEELELKMPKVALPLRVAVTGTSFSPSIDLTLELIGREKTLARLGRAIDFMKSQQGG